MKGQKIFILDVDRHLLSLIIEIRNYFRIISKTFFNIRNLKLIVSGIKRDVDLLDGTKKYIFFTNFHWMPSTVRTLSPECKTPNPQVIWNRLPLLRRVRTVPFFPLLDLCIISFICLLISPYNYIIKLIGFETPWTLDPPTEGFRWGRGLHSPRRDVPNCTPTHCTFGNDKLWNMSELYAIVRGHVLSAPENRTFWNDRGRPRGTRSLSPGWPPGSNHFRNVSFWCVLLQWSISSLPDFN